MNHFLLALLAWAAAIAPNAHIMVDLRPYLESGAPARTACYRQGDERIFVVLVSAKAVRERGPMELGHLALHEVCHIRFQADSVCDGERRPQGWMSWSEENEAEKCVLGTVARLGMDMAGRPIR